MNGLGCPQHGATSGCNLLDTGAASYVVHCMVITLHACNGLEALPIIKPGLNSSSEQVDSAAMTATCGSGSFCFSLWL